MLFYIDESIINRLNEENVRSAIDNLVHAIKYGMHILYSERRILEALYKSEFLSEETKAIFKKLFFNCSEMKECMNSVQSYIKVVGNSEQVYKENTSKAIINIPIDYLIDMTLLGEVMLIFEDIDDYEVYKRICEYYLYSKKLDKLKIRLNEVSGSGSGISNSFIKKVNQKKYFVIAIADTDKKAPEDEFGRTLRDLVDEYEKVKHECLGNIFYSNFSEVENLIPTYIYEQEINLSNEEITSYKESAVTTSVNNGKTYISFKEFLLIMHREDRKDMTNYFDFKKGLNILTLNKSECVKKYWKDILYASGLESEVLAKLNGDQCVIDNYAKRPLKKVINIFKEESIVNIDAKMDADKKVLWNEIGQFLYSWGCATRPMRAI